MDAAPAPKTPRRRLGVVGLMILVALAAVGASAWVRVMRGSRQAAIYRSTAHSHSVSEQLYRNRAGQLEHLLAVSEIGLDHRRDDARDERDLQQVARDERMSEDQRGFVRHADRMADYHGSLARKYTMASASPWDPVEADPDPPALPVRRPEREEVRGFPPSRTLSGRELPGPAKLP
jgi:hypothetical protein